MTEKFYKCRCPKGCDWAYTLTEDEYRKVEEDICGPVDERPGVINWDRWESVTCPECKTEFTVLIEGTWYGKSSAIGKLSEK